MFWELLEAVIHISGIKFWFSDRNTENAMSLLYLNECSDYFEENICENEVFRSTIERN